jgi:hypothetical protein
MVDGVGWGGDAREGPRALRRCMRGCGLRRQGAAVDITNGGSVAGEDLGFRALFIVST